jgi:hypothetical protein
MIAMANCVKPLAVPGPPPGPCEAKAAFAHSVAVTIDAAVAAMRDKRCLVRDDVMIISCDKLQKIRTTAYAGFEKNPVIIAGVQSGKGFGLSQSF